MNPNLIILIVIISLTLWLVTGIVSWFKARSEKRLNEFRDNRYKPVDSRKLIEIMRKRVGKL